MRLPITFGLVAVLAIVVALTFLPAIHRPTASVGF